MRYSPEHKAALRARLIERGRLLSKAMGFAGTSIDTLMHSVGLSGAAFYRHFRSKDELFSILIDEEMTQSLNMLGSDATSSDAEFAGCLRRYLSVDHAIHPGQGCAIPALGAEIARGKSEDRLAVEASLQQLQATWSKRLNGDTDAAWSALSQCVGALLLARVMERDTSRRAVLSGVRRSLAKQFGLPLSRAASATPR